jgi:hypothetical protein
MIAQLWAKSRLPVRAGQRRLFARRVAQYFISDTRVKTFGHVIQSVILGAHWTRKGVKRYVD